MYGQGYLYFTGLGNPVKEVVLAFLEKGSIRIY